MMQKMTEAQRELAERNLPLVNWCLKNRVPFWKKEEYDDLFQVGSLALCEAAMRYDERTGVRFGTFACEYIVGKIRNYAKWNARKKRTMDLPRLEDMPGADMEGITMADQTPSAEDGESMERMLILRETMGRIKGRDREVLDLTVQGFGQVEIGRRMRTSQPNVGRILRRARKLIADEYAR